VRTQLPTKQGKIERYQRTLKNRILLQNCYLEGELEAAISAVVDHYNNHHYHESIDNLTLAEVYHGTGETTLKIRGRSRSKQSRNAGCSTKSLTPKMNKEPDKSLLCDTAIKVRETLNLNKIRSVRSSY
jgi:hypothetical protein